MVFMFKASELLEKQINEVVYWHVKAPEPDNDEVSDFPSLVSRQHYVNFELWHQEDMARDPDASDSKIAAVKRTIDVLNQLRRNWINKKFTSKALYLSLARSFRRSSVEEISFI